MKERFKVLLLLAVLCIIGYTYVLRDSYNNRGVVGDRKLVLLWTPFFGHLDWVPPCGRCDVTSNRSLAPLSHALVVHWRDVRADDPPPQDGPLVVLFNRESPSHTPSEDSLLNLTVHWTATYRRDSDIYAPYGEIVPREDPYHPPDIPANRSLVCWLVSNCRTPIGREEYVRQLKLYINVKVYGKCGEYACPYTERPDCYKWLSERCQFYLSFENSRCRDYVTEKLYLALAQDNMVPVVMGGEDYERHLPANSFVDAAHFPSPRDLAAHLKALGGNQTAYSALLTWKRRWKSRPLAYEWMCALCDRLLLYDTVPPQRNDIADWWFGRGECGSSVLNFTTTRGMTSEGQ